MRILVSLLLALGIFFSSVNSCSFAKIKSSEKSTDTVQEKVKKEKQVKEKKVKEKKVKTAKPKKEKVSKKTDENYETEVSNKIKKNKKEKVKKQKHQKQESAEVTTQSSSFKLKPGKFYNDKQLQNMSQTEREQALVNEHFRYRQRSTLAMKLNPNLDVIEIRASHILVRNRKDALNIRKDILDGKITFEDAAMQYSLCPTSINGGDLGYFNRKKMDQNFADRAFDLKIGEISEPVGTKFGWHLIKVVDKR